MPCLEMIISYHTHTWYGKQLDESSLNTFNIVELTKVQIARKIRLTFFILTQQICLNKGKFTAHNFGGVMISFDVDHMM